MFFSRKMDPNRSTLKLVTLIVAICIFFVGPILTIAFFPFLLLRNIMGKLGPYLNPELKKLVSARSTFFASEDIYNNPKNNVLFVKVLEGDLDTNLAKAILQRDVIEAVDSEGGLLYPELRQYITVWNRYYFWKGDKTFDSNNHVRLFDGGKSDGERFTDSDWTIVREKLVHKKWTKKKPLWEILFIKNYFPSDAEDESKSHTLFIWRIHHSLCSGYSFAHLVKRYLDEKEKEFKSPLPEQIKRSLLDKLIFFLTAPYGMSLIGAEYLLMPFVEYPWRVPYAKQRDAKTLFHFTDKIPISRIKDIKRHFNVSFSSVLFAALAGAQREMIIKKNYPLPNVLPTVSFLPISPKSIKLDNNVTIFFVHFPVGEPDPIKRLKFCNNDYQNLKTSHAPLYFKYLLPLAMSSFDPLLKLVSNNKVIVSGLSNFPAELTPVYFTGLKFVDTMFVTQLFQGCIGTGATILSYMDHIRICQMASSAMLSKEDVREMALSIQRQIDLLHKHVQSHTEVHPANLSGNRSIPNDCIIVL